jgi:membrane peptidoglycan carboxypeptidase
MGVSPLVRAVGRSLLRDEWRALRIRVAELSAAIPDEDPAWVLPDHLRQLLIAGEDRRFYRHPGYDVLAMARAVWLWVSSGQLTGASTVHQQLVRVVTGRFERTLTRKLRELMLASLLAASLPRDRVLRLYVHLAYYGWRMNGFRQACRRLQLSPQDMSVEDAAGLIARLKYPEPRLAPDRRRDQITRRIRYLLATRQQLQRTHEGHLPPEMWHAAVPRT